MTPIDQTDEFEAVLGDGTPVCFRQIRPDDKVRLQTGLRQLSLESRYLRFFRSVNRFSDQELKYLTELDFCNHFAWIATLPKAMGEPAIGVGRWIRIAGEPDVAEAAITVADRYQRRGIGRTLLSLMVRSALENEIRGFRAWILSDNRAAFQLLRHFGASGVKWESGVGEFTVPLPKDVREIDETLAPLISHPASMQIRDAAIDVALIDEHDGHSSGRS